MIYDKPVPAVDSEMPCDYCGSRDGVVQIFLQFLCIECQKQLSEVNYENNRVFKT